MIEPYLTAVLLLAVRVSAFVAFLPLYGGSAIPKTVKVGLAVALTAAFAAPVALAGPILSPSGAFSWPWFAWLVARESAFGAGSAWLLGLLLVPVRIAGNYIAQEMGLSMATLTSATDNGGTNVLAEILESLTILGFLGLNGHHLFFRGLGAGFELFPVGRIGSLPDSAWILSSVTGTTAAGLELAEPIGTLLLIVSLTLLFIMRQTPQFNLFNFGMPARLLAGLGAAVLFIPDVIRHTLEMIQHWAGRLGG